jgi:hypothetical protein
MPNVLVAPLLALVMAGGVQAQQPLGQLLYATRAGRGISLTVVDGGHPAFVTLKPEVGDAEAFRIFVLTHSGPEALIAKGALLLKEQAPQGWRAGPTGTQAMLTTPEATYWRYTAGLVLPARFTWGKQTWSLSSANVPPRMFVDARR